MVEFKLGNINLRDVENSILLGDLPGFEKYNPKKDREWLFGGFNNKQQSAINAWVEFKTK